jgi:hypothetical protein
MRLAGGLDLGIVMIGFEQSSKKWPLRANEMASTKIERVMEGGR